MKNKIFQFLCFFSFVIITSCGSRKEIVYFQNQEQLTTSFEQFTPKIQPTDQLAIVISAADVAAVAPFNQMRNNQNTASSNSISPYSPTYTVDENGNISLPMVGNVKLAGLTRSQAIETIKNKVSKYVVNPGVNVNFVNFRISVLGEVSHPGSFIVPTERITLLDALGMAGDLTIKGKRENVTVIRESNGVKQRYNVDLTSESALNSPVYYLAQNDVVYVEPNSAQVSASKFTPNYSLWISMAGVIISVISVLTR
ncbi:polysaccharide biosynthesis/export family protein [Empedobacter stercoris]|uniref:Polysaccharide biosynthesis/export family protein n=1 Tax=Empedobacter falsenii TaxID=343874 RepID=A0ABY8V404_9FLAO|nr:MULTISPECIES: polysaccharide biosynthesis/export family protein [Empedobacter]UWX65999.1 polysaccharide biosynthesis/export family protein [Empedobacter stercoris]WIH96213.1 polysaccharide biosynthesis/export family protein [Empedobacter falsenii]